MILPKWIKVFTWRPPWTTSKLSFLVKRHASISLHPRKKRRVLIYCFTYKVLNWFETWYQDIGRWCQQESNVLHYHLIHIDYLNWNEGYCIDFSCTDLPHQNMPMMANTWSDQVTTGNELTASWPSSYRSLISTIWNNRYNNTLIIYMGHNAGAFMRNIKHKRKKRKLKDKKTIVTKERFKQMSSFCKWWPPKIRHNRTLKSPLLTTLSLYNYLFEVI